MKSRRSLLTADTAVNVDSLPLVLLAAVSHPDPDFRERLRERLDDGIEQRRPVHSVDAVRDFLRAELGGPGLLEPVAEELAVRIVRLVFARRTTRDQRRHVEICVGDQKCGRCLLVDRSFTASWRDRNVDGELPPRLPRDACFVAGDVGSRLQQLAAPNKLVRATCRVQDGFCLEVSGEFRSLSYWGPHPSTTLVNRVARKLELKVEQQPGRVSLSTTTPEAMIRFSALLAQGAKLVLRPSWCSALGQVVVQLRPFDGDVVELPVVLGCHDAETWLRGVPAPRLVLDGHDLLAISRGLYPLDAWLSQDGLLEKLLS